MKVYRDSTGEFDALKGKQQEALFSRVCDSFYNEQNGKCWALQNFFEDGQQWVLFDTSITEGRIEFTLRDCQTASFLVESDEQLKAWEKQFISMPTIK
ncbi:hypothetical protein [Neisseria sp. Ec49-e6-T10]|uniref:hypothetical protein n=1 Tax=Neisseria sp. Ec49-e6-T10 TaxID=3140744 RepID=UPI003EBAFC67